MPGAELRLLRRGLAVVLILLFCGVVTAFAFSSLTHKRWGSRLVKGEYKGTVDEIAEEDTEPQFTEIPPNVIVSEPVQIFVATPDEAVFDDGEGIEEEHIDEEPEQTIAVENTEEIIEPEEPIIAAPDENENIENITAGSGEEIGE